MLGNYVNKTMPMRSKNHVILNSGSYVKTSSKILVTVTLGSYVRFTLGNYVMKPNVINT